jgi:hypothetical protein
MGECLAAKVGQPPLRCLALRTELVEQRLGVIQIGSVKAFGESAVQLFGGQATA